MATLKELSEYTGFSITTISRVLNNDPTMNVSDATRSKILQAAGELQYKKPNTKQRIIRENNMCFAVAEMLSPAEQLEDPYYLYLKNHAAQRIQDTGCIMVQTVFSNSKYEIVGTEKINGVLAIGIFSETQIEALQNLSKNIVFLDSSPDELKFDSVVLNYRLGVEQAVDALISAGHTKIGFLGPDRKLDQRKRPAPEVRRQYFIDYMKAQGLFNEDLLLEAKMTAKEAHDRVIKHLKSGKELPTAIITANEEAAFGAMRAFRESNIKVPKDISIISFNDTPLSELTEPPLTSISTHVDAMSQTAVDLLIRRSKEQERIVPIKIVVPSSLVERESVSKI